MEIRRVDIDSIRPADYNPRRISDKQFLTLQDSLRSIGFVIPILVNSNNNTIIAGHQRTKAAKAVGMRDVPAFFIDNLGVGDEIKFNQIHNGVDHESETNTAIVGEYPDGFNEIDRAAFQVNNHGAPYVKEICKLISRYGNVLCAVVCGGRVIFGSNYIKSCQLLRIDVNAYVMQADLYDKAVEYFGGDYGEYSYDNIKRNTYVQGLAQLYRSTDKQAGKKQQASMLYEHYVVPFLQSAGSKSVLDFGCGKGAYIGMLKRYHDAIGVEFYNNDSRSINISKGNRQIDKLIKHIETKGRFDVVVCDSVLNSVDSVMAECNVMACLNLLTRDMLFVSGRPYDAAVEKLACKSDIYNAKRFIEFVDGNKFSANYRSGNWYFQHYHTRQDVEELINESGFEIQKLTWRKHGDSWQVQAKKVRELENDIYRKAVDFEFNLPLPCGRSYERNEEIKRALGI